MKKNNIIKNMKTYTIIPLSIIIVSLVISGQAIAASSTKSHVAKNHKNENVPAWVINPYDITENPEVTSFKFCAVGSAPDSGNYSNQKRIAKINAYAELSKSMNVDIDDTVSVKKKVVEKNKNVEENTTDISSTTYQKSNSTVTNYREINQHFDPASKILYVRICQ